MMISPQVHQLTGKLRAIIRKQVTWRAALLDQAIEDHHHVFPAEPLADFDGSSFTAVEVDDGQRPEALAII